MSKCDKHNRVRVTPDNWALLAKLKKQLGLSLSTPSLANDMMKRGIEDCLKRQPKIL
jgi:hypothetical protein